MRIDIITVVPELLSSPLNESILKRAQESGHAEIYVHNLRDYTDDKRRTVDDYPFGGEAGMVMKIEPVFRCIEKLKSERDYDEIIFTSPDGITYNQHEANRLSMCENIIILCGHYKGIDYRIREHLITREISIGDYVVTGGEIPACIVIDAVSRLKEGVLAASECYEDESVASGILEYPQYTKPRVFEGLEVPEVLTSGDHKKIERWRLERAVEITRERRPEMLLAHPEFEEALQPKKKKRRKSEPQS